MPEPTPKPSERSIFTQLVLGLFFGVLLFLGAKYYESFDSTEPAFRYREF